MQLVKGGFSYRVKKALGWKYGSADTSTIAFVTSETTSGTLHTSGGIPLRLKILLIVQRAQDSSWIRVRWG